MTLQGEPATHIIGVRALPDTLPDSGGVAHLAGQVAHATTCQLVLLSSDGLPATYPHTRQGCTGGHFFFTVAIGANTSLFGRTLSFAVVARNAVSEDSVTLTLPVDGVGTATVTSVALSADVVPASGGTVTVTAAVEHAVDCQLRLSPAAGVAVSYPSAPEPCATGLFRTVLSFGANQAASTLRASFSVIARNSLTTGSAGFHIDQLGAPATKVISVQVAPAILPPTGGTVTVSGQVANATSCQVREVSAFPGAQVSVGPVAPCSDGQLLVTVTVLAAATTSERTAVFSVVAENAVSTGSATFDVTLAAQQQGDLITNGCFQVAGLVTGWQTFEGGSTQIPGWTVSGNSVDVNSSQEFEPPPGCDYSVDLAGNAEGAVYQVVATVPGANYELRWELAGNLANLPVVKTMKVYWGGQLAGTYTFDTTGHSNASMGWVTEQLEVTAQGASTMVEFADASGITMNGSCLGDVSLTPLPS